MNNLNPIAEWLVKKSETIQRFDEQMKQHGVRQHMLASCKEALLCLQAVIESTVEVIEETEKTASAEHGTRKVSITD